MIQEFENTNDFILKVDEIINGKYFENYILIDAISRVSYYGEEYFESYIIGDIGNYIIGFCFNGNYMFYGENWSNDQIVEAQKKVKLINYQKGFHISGNNELVKKLTSDLNVEIFKDRIYYRKKNKVELKSNFVFELANIEDLETLSIMMCEYFEDEYNGKNNKEIEQMRNEVKKSIEKETIWILKSENEIISMCSTIFTQFNITIIGSFFTKRNYRNKNYGTHLLNYVSNAMIDKFGEVTLLGDKNHPESIKVFEKLEYQNVYENLDVIIK